MLILETALNLTATIVTLWGLVVVILMVIQRVISMRRSPVHIPLSYGLFGTRIQSAIRSSNGSLSVKFLGDTPHREIEAMAREWISSRPSGVLAFAIIQRNWEQVCLVTNQSGKAELPNGEDTCFEIASITKTMTATLAAHCIEQGLVDLDTPIGDILDTYLHQEADSRAITIGQLVTHSSGLPRLDPGLIRRIRLSGTLIDPYRMYSRDKLFDFLNRWRRPTQIDSQYSNLGIDLLGVVLSELLEIPLEEALQSHIWEPLGMRDTYLNTSKHHSTRLTPGFTKLGLYAPPWTHPLGGAGGVHSSIRDMRKYLAAALSNGPSSVERAISRSRSPLASFNPGNRGRNSICMCWIRQPDGITWHNGMTGGYSSFICTTDKGSGVVIMSNYASSVDSLGINITRILDKTADPN
jgi:serine-type D-Ala-D-Ala carboxypeptidase/endopeptidase